MGLLKWTLASVAAVFLTALTVGLISPSLVALRRGAPAEAHGRSRRAQAPAVATPEQRAHWMAGMGAAPGQRAHWMAGAGATPEQRAQWMAGTGAAPEQRAHWMAGVVEGAGAVNMVEARKRAWEDLPPGFDPPSSWPTERRCFSTPASDVKGTAYCLPAVLGLCCMGAGTSSFAMYLNHHPNFSYGVTKEHRFLTIGFGKYAAPNTLTRQDMARYAVEFPVPSHTLKHGFDFSPMYVLRDGKRKAHHIHAVLGKHTRFLMLYREPAQAFCKTMLRMTSLQTRQCVAMALTEQEVAAAPEVIDLKSGTPPRQRCVALMKDFCLADMMRPWLEEFPLRQFWLMRTQDLEERPQELLQNFSLFMRVPPYQYPTQLLQSRMHVRGVSRGGAYLGAAARNAMLARAAVPRKSFDRCVAAQMAPGTYLSGCSARLEQLRKQRLELPATSLDDALHAEFMATLVR